MLLLPNLSTIGLSNAWELDARSLLLASLWVCLFLYCMIPRRWFLIVTYPIIVAGIVVLGADLQRSVNVLDLLAVSYTFGRDEVLDAVRPYLFTLALISVAVLMPIFMLWRGDRLPGISTASRLGVVFSGAALVIALPNTVWLNAWPVDLLAAALEANSQEIGIELPRTANLRFSPRDRFRTWKGSRKNTPSEAETYVFLIGESVRSDRINGCGGRSRITAPSPDSILYCDVLSGSSNTHTAVPLLISRELPGHKERISSDSTFLNAFEALGFESFWFAVQERPIAWPDAKNQFFGSPGPLDRDTLLPLLEQALGKPNARKIIVLHAYNAHSPYPDRYRVEAAPFAVNRKVVDFQLPTESFIGEWWNAYDNAIDESMRFMNDILERLRAERGQVFFVFTPDHGENMRDDQRNLLQHALKFPTKWDTRVPAVIWANPLWRQAHPDKWRTLELNKGMSLMHMDFVPTILGAAEIEYEEHRSLPVDLTSRVAGPRTRITQVRAGDTIDTVALEREARASEF